MKRLAVVLAAGVLALGLAACGDDGSSGATGGSSSDTSAPPPPPAQFGSPHDWGNGNSVTVEGPRNETLPGPLRATLVQVKVHNGAQNAVQANQYRADVNVDGVGRTATAFGVAAVPNGQVQSNSDAQFTVVFEAAPPGAKLDVTVTGPNNLPGVTYEGQAP